MIGQNEAFSTIAECLPMVSKGHPYGELPPCIHVGILNFNQMISPNYYHKFCLMDEKTKEIYSRKFQFHMLEIKEIKV